MGQLHWKWHYTGAIAACVGFGILGCSPAPTDGETGEAGASETAETDALPTVVATNSVLCDLTQQIAEDTVALTCLMEAGQDPHVYQPTPSDRQAIEEADLVLYDGYDYAPGLIRMVEDANTAGTKVAVYEAAVPTPLMVEPHSHDHGDHGHGDDGHGDDDHGHGDDDHGHGETAAGEMVPDPHVYHSAPNNGAIAMVIAAQLEAVNPDQGDRYATNAEELASQFISLDGWIQAQVDTVAVGDRRLVTTHDAFRYFADAYGFEVAGAISGLSTQEQPTATRMTEMVETVRAAQVKAIFAEGTTNPQLIQTVARDAGVEVPETPLFVAGPGAPGSGGETVQAMLVSNTCVIVNGLGGQCDPSTAPL
ncbi:MAG: zinc ABC transporter substrate-binding protein [Leptolyngbyaceae cyanobacterium T60_A2020_046]|nr:zinc ABC transporter substrate-binding protein [Leptolyngbyaceae cyanobacterium T60_A2020_046]